jgi:hypothetical protein
MLSLYQLIFNFLIKIISFVLDSELDEVQLRRLGLVVKNLQQNNRFTFEFFTQTEREKKKSVKKKRKFTVNKAKKVSKMEEEIIQVRPASPEIDKISVISMADVSSDEIKFTLDVGSEENNFKDNWFIRKFECIFDWKIFKFFRVVDGKHILTPEISFMLNRRYEEAVFVVFLLYMKYGINREIYSYDGSTLLFSIKNNLVKITKFIQTQLEFNKIDTDGYHFSIISKYDSLYPTIEELEEEGSTLTNLVINNYKGFICRCQESENECHNCKNVMKILHLVNERMQTCSCGTDHCGWCKETMLYEQVLELSNYNYQCINSSKINTLCYANDLEVIKAVRNIRKEIYVKYKKHEEVKPLTDKISSQPFNLGVTSFNQLTANFGSIDQVEKPNAMTFDNAQKHVNHKNQSSAPMLRFN